MLKDRIRKIMNSDESHPVLSWAGLMSGLSMAYSAVVRFRRHLYAHGFLKAYHLPCPVISVGNLAVGGTGKTPMVIHLAELVLELGYRPVIISRGYKGRGEKKGAVVSDGKAYPCGAGEAGDEPSLMARLMPRVPVVVGSDRYAAGRRAVENFDPDLILLDDAFQHLRLHRDLNLLLLDAAAPFGNTFLLPRGLLREPVTAVRFADAVILTRADQNHPEAYIELIRRVHPRPVFICSHSPLIRMSIPPHQQLDFSMNFEPSDQKVLHGKTAFAFSGIARNDTFFKTVQMLGARVKGTLAFEDHHVFDMVDIEKILQEALAVGANCLVTTDKDFVRLSGKLRFPLPLVVVGVVVNFGDQQDLWRTYVVDNLNKMIERYR